jgi:peptidyl-prolyl cis-trans isomerase C
MMKKLIIPLFLLPLLSPACVLAETATEGQSTNNPVFVTINGVDITEKEVRHFVSRLTDAQNPQDALRELINVELINQAAKNENLLDDETLQMEIWRSTSALVASTYLRNFVSNLQISDKQVEARYQSDYIDGGSIQEFNANHILVQTEEEAQAIIRKLDEGTDFEELAKAFSVGPSGKTGGALGWFQKNDMVAPFSAATAELEKGRYSKTPVQTQFGWHVIQLNDTRKPETPALDDVRDEITNTIAAERFRQKLEELQKNAAIKFH